MLNFSEIWSGIKHDQARHFVEMKRNIGGCLQRLEDMPGYQRGKHGACLRFGFKAQSMEHGRAWVPLPSKRAAQLKQFTVQLLKSTGFGEGPTPHPWREEKRKFGVFCGCNTARMKGHESA